MTKESVIWTALPNGMDEEDRLQLSVFVSPRLSNADGSPNNRRLEEFPAFSNWPGRLEGIQFTVEFDSGDVFEGVPQTKPDPAIWERLLPPGTTVKPFVFQNHASRYLHAFPVRGVLEFLTKAYGDLGAQGTELPAIADPNSPLAPFLPLGEITTWIRDKRKMTSFWDEFVRAKEGDQSEGQVVQEIVGTAAQNTFFQAYRFYNRPGNNRPDFDVDHVEPYPDPPKFDFHRIIAQFGDHPEIMRMLGLVIDLVIELDDPASQLPSPGTVRVVPEGDLPGEPPILPRTHYELDKGWFGARPNNDFNLWRGLLRMHEEYYDLFQVDVDGAAMQVVGFGSTLLQYLNPDLKGPETPDEAAAPALRSGGFSVARTRRADDLLVNLKDARKRNDDAIAGKDVALFAEDLLRGYRVDVHDQDADGGARWYSLHQRCSEHQVGDPAGAADSIDLEIHDEGYIKATAASGERTDHPTPSDDLYLHETLFGWEGWSLSAPRPGKHIGEPVETDDPERPWAPNTVDSYDPKEGNPHALISRIFAEKGTLPRLRVGHRYRLRARTVDLAGNSRRFSDQDYDTGKEEYLTTEEQPFLRFEPVPSPTVLRRHIDTEGESLEHLAIRSNYNQSAQDYVASPAVLKALADADVPHTYADRSRRYLAAPKGSQLMAELHGRFDGAFGGSQAQINTALRMALREEGTFLDEQIIDIATGQKTLNQSTILVHPAAVPLPAPTDRGAGLPGGAYSYYPDESLTLPYLPDPLAIGVSVIGFDFKGTKVFEQIAMYTGEWPNVAPFQLRLVETGGPPAAEFDGDVLEVRLPKAKVVRARLSSVFPGDRLEDLAIWHWIPEQKKDEQLAMDAVEGRHWMFTPFRTVTFTHAVQQPLMEPDSTGLVVKRDLGDTHASFQGVIKNHAQSTGRLDVYAEWTEDIDLLTDDAPKMKAFNSAVEHEAFAFGFEIGPGEDQAAPTIAGGTVRLSRHEFGDTKYRKVTYHSVATTRFREFFPETITGDPGRIQREEAAWIDEETPFEELVRHVPSSARPAAPEVLYVLPTFRWEKDDKGETRVHVRHGKSVRVWLGRPWFSSGDGEQLAVLLEPGFKLPIGWFLDPFLEYSVVELAGLQPRVSPAPLMRLSDAAGEFTGGMVEESIAENINYGSVDYDFAEIEAVGVVAGGDFEPPSADAAHDMLRPYVTTWGQDPVWKSSLTERPPTVADFPRHTGYAAGLTLEEVTPLVKVQAVAHDVFYDKDRDLWYCDIEIDPGDTYYPFVRLGLARYQKHSLTGAHLSRVVTSDFIQLPPDRTAKISFSGGNAQISVEGYSGRNILPIQEQHLAHNPYTPALVNKPNTSIRAVLQVQSDDIPGDLGWQKIGSEISLHAEANGFHMTWTGELPLPDDALGAGKYRIQITEVETHRRDPKPDDSPLSTAAPVRERVVYADHFEL